MAISMKKISCTILFNSFEATGTIDRIVIVDSDVPTSKPLSLKVNIILSTINSNKDIGLSFSKPVQGEKKITKL